MPIICPLRTRIAPPNGTTWSVFSHGILTLHFPPKRLRTDPAGVISEIRRAIGKGQERPPLPVKGLPPPG